jgi:hypothetical protein
LGARDGDQSVLGATNNLFGGPFGLPTEAHLTRHHAHCLCLGPEIGNPINLVIRQQLGQRRLGVFAHLDGPLGGVRRLLELAVRG